MSLASPQHVAPPPAAAPAVGPATRARTWKLALVTIFLALLLAPTLDLVFGLDPNPSPTQGQVKFPRPHLDRSLLKWPGSLVWYLKNNMGFRGALVRAHGRFVWSALGGSPAPGSVVRADPWLFLKSERVPDDYRRVDPFSETALARWSTVLEGRRQWLAARGIHYVLMIPPNKETVYPEAVPPWLTRAPGPSRLEQLAAQLRTTTGVELVDPTAPLVAAKGEARLYHYTDTHWNDVGAFVGYQALMARLQPWLPSLRPLTRVDTIARPELTPGGDLARIVGLQVDLPEPQVWLTLRPEIADDAREDDGSPLVFQRMDVQVRERFVSRAPAGEIASAVILRDSFGEALIPYLARHFQKATWIWTDDFPKDVIEREKPALVIQQLVQRKLMALEPRP